MHRSHLVRPVTHQYWCCMCEHWCRLEVVSSLSLWMLCRHLGNTQLDGSQDLDLSMDLSRVAEPFWITCLGWPMVNVDQDPPFI
ncbi:hypothetical protein INR49_012516 [Caranx melampygus]|nr:hypothetical protein INR49_012516 [Caranx melampygus]